MAKQEKERTNLGKSRNSSSDDQKEKSKSVPYWKLFRHADFLDVVMVLVGCLLSFSTGAAVPIESFLMGRLFNIFISYNAGKQLSNLLTNDTNGSCTAEVAQQILANVPNSSNEIFCDVSKEGNVINSASNFVCDPDSMLAKEATTHSVYFVILAASVFVARFIGHNLWNISASRQSRRIRIAFYRSALNHDIGWFETKDTSRLGPLFVKGIENIQAGIGTQAGLLIQDISVFISGIVWAFFINWKLAFVVLTMLPVLSVAGGLNVRASKTSKHKEERAYLKAGSVATEVLSAIRTVMAFGGEDREERRYKVHAKEAETQAIRGGFFTSLFVGISFLAGLGMFGIAFWVATLAVAGITCQILNQALKVMGGRREEEDLETRYGSVLIVNCEILGGDVLTVMTLVLYGAFALGGALPQIGTFISASSSAADVFNIIDQVPSNPTGNHKPKICNGCIEFAGVHFSYPSRPDVEILNGLSFSIEPGQTVAIVGPSGSGKSTILQLIQQLYSCDDGQVLIDGVNIQELDSTWLRSNIAVVTQEPVLFNTSIRENILLANPQATQEEMEAVAIKANAHTFITELPEGYDTYVGEGGIQLSGGQKQRVAIARALIRNPKILLLDEATSALDTRSERLVQSALERASKDHTTLIVAHRLSTVQNADHILCIKKGKIEEGGNHEQLMEKEGFYSELVGTQLHSGPTGEESAEQESKRFKRQTLSVRSMKSKKSMNMKSLRRYQSYADAQWLDYVPPLSKSNMSANSVDERSPKNAKLIPLWKFIKPDWYIILIGVIFYSIIGASYPIIGALMANVNAVFGESDKDTIVELSRNISIGFIALSIAAGLFYFIGSFTVTASGERLTTRLRVQLFKALLHNDVGWYDKQENTTGSLNAMLYIDANNVKTGTGIRLGIIVLATTSVITAVAVCFASSWELTLLVLLAFPLIFTSYRLSNSLYRHTGSADDQSIQESTHIVIETIEHIKTVVSLGAEEYFVNTVNTHLRSHIKYSIRKAFLQAFAISFTAAAVLCVYAAGWRLAVYLVTEGRVSIVAVFRVIAAIVVTARNVTFALNGAPESSEAYESGGQILSVIQDSESSQLSQTGDKKLEATFGCIAGNNLYFSYPCRPDVNVLHKMSVSVTPGQTLALVGSSGGGKSTVIALIERFYHPSVGVITLDGQDITSLDLKWLRSQIGYVPQEPVLFNTTIADNIRYGALFRDVSNEEIVEVAKACHIHDFIESLPLGYHTNVGFGGTQLSGGQKQRVAIARALLRNPKILLLDEATSSLDAESEQAVQQTLKTARVGRTSIVVAHRLSTIRDADCIAVVQNGQVAESGTHASLMAAKGDYYNLVNAHN